MLVHLESDFRRLSKNRGRTEHPKNTRKTPEKHPENTRKTPRKHQKTPENTRKSSNDTIKRSMRRVSHGELVIRRAEAVTTVGSRKDVWKEGGNAKLAAVAGENTSPFHIYVS